MLSNMTVTIPRDEKMYNMTDLRTNIHLDNTKEERQEEQDRKNEDRMNRMRLHTQQNQRRQWKYATQFTNSMMGNRMQTIDIEHEL